MADIGDNDEQQQPLQAIINRDDRIGEKCDECESSLGKILKPCTTCDIPLHRYCFTHRCLNRMEFRCECDSFYCQTEAPETFASYMVQYFFNKCRLVISGVVGIMLLLVLTPIYLHAYGLLDIGSFIVIALSLTLITYAAYEPILRAKDYRTFFSRTHVEHIALSGAFIDSQLPPSPHPPPYEYVENIRQVEDSELTGNVAVVHQSDERNDGKVETAVENRNQEDSELTGNIAVVNQSEERNDEEVETNIENRNQEEDSELTGNVAVVNQTEERNDGEVETAV